MCIDGIGATLSLILSTIRTCTPGEQVDAGLDGVKIAGCGGDRNVGLYQSLLNKTNTNFLIQDCHDSILDLGLIIVIN